LPGFLLPGAPKPPLLPLLGNQNPQRKQGAFEGRKEGRGSSNSVPAAAAVVGWLT